MSYWKLLAKHLSARYNEDEDFIPKDSVSLQRSRDMLEFPSKYGWFVIKSQYNEQDYSYLSTSDTNFRLELSQSTDLLFKIEESIVYERIWYGLFPKKNLFFYNNLCVRTNQDSKTHLVLREINFDQFLIRSIELRIENQKSILALETWEDFIMKKNANDYINLIEGIAKKLIEI